METNKQQIITKLKLSWQRLEKLKGYLDLERELNRLATEIVKDLSHAHFSFKTFTIVKVEIEVQNHRLNILIKPIIGGYNLEGNNRAACVKTMYEKLPQVRREMEEVKHHIQNHLDNLYRIISQIDQAGDEKIIYGIEKIISQDTQFYHQLKYSQFYKNYVSKLLFREIRPFFNFKQM